MASSLSKAVGSIKKKLKAKGDKKPYLKNITLPKGAEKVYDAPALRIDGGRPVVVWVADSYEHEGKFCIKSMAEGFPSSVDKDNISSKKEADVIARRFATTGDFAAGGEIGQQMGSTVLNPESSYFAKGGKVIDISKASKKEAKAFLSKISREDLISFLQKEDKDGTYSDEATTAEYGKPSTKKELEKSFWSIWNEHHYAKGGEVEKTRDEYEEYLNELGVPDADMKSNGGRIPDTAKYGSWMRRNDKIAFNVGYSDWVRESFAKGGKTKKGTASDLYAEVVDIMKKDYGLDPDDYDWNEERAKEVFERGETAKEWTDWYAEKYDLFRADGKYAKGGRVKVTKPEKVTIMLAIGLLGQYKTSFTETQSGYWQTNELIESWKERPTNIHYINLALLSLTNYKKDKNANSGDHKTIDRVMIELEEMVKKYKDSGDNNLSASAIVLKYKGKIKGEADVKSFFRSIYQDLNLAFHPDDDFNEMTVEFKKKDGDGLNQVMEECFDWCHKNDRDIYEIGLEVQQTEFKKRGIFMEAGGQLGETPGSTVVGETNPSFEDGGKTGNLKTLHSGRYLTLATQGGKLHIFLTDEGKEWVKDNGHITYDKFWELFEDIANNSELLYFPDLSDAGLGLTSAPGITDGYYYGVSWELENREDSNIWYYEPYMIKDPFEELTKEGEVDFDGHSDNKLAAGGEIGEPLGSTLLNSENMSFPKGGSVKAKSLDDVFNDWTENAGKNLSSADYIKYELLLTHFASQTSENAKTLAIQKMNNWSANGYKTHINEKQLSDGPIYFIYGVKEYESKKESGGEIGQPLGSTVLNPEATPFAKGGKPDHISIFEAAKIGREYIMHTKTKGAIGEVDSDFQKVSESIDKYISAEYNRIPNPEAGHYSENRIPFKGNNLEGRVFDNGDYAVLSFGIYPLWYYSAKQEKWFGNADRLSQIIGLHASQSKPGHNAPLLPMVEFLHQIMPGEAKFQFGGSVADLTEMFPNMVQAHGPGGPPSI